MMEKKFVENITSRDVDFAQWYTDVCLKAELCAYTNIKGCIIYRPLGYAIWENIQKGLDKKFKETGVQNVYMPLLIPESLLNKEKDHVKGFAPEVAWVTEGGSEKLEERLCIRPTSETLFCDHFKEIAKSYRDLPILYNQWCSVLRWEKTTRPFLRGSEFLWQEGHTIHATAEEAKLRTKQMLDVYYNFVTEELAIPLLRGRKTENEKFAGAEETYTIEAMMHDGKALQSGTSHYFGDGFAKAFDIKFVDKDNKLKYVHETSWGLSTRIIGALIMVHGDDSGLVLPPRIAPIQTMVVPIMMDKKDVKEKALEILTSLKSVGIRTDIDLTDKSPGYKFSEQEMKGIPTRIEIGPKEIEKGEIIVVRRDTREKIYVGIDEITTKLSIILDSIQKNLYKKAQEMLDNNIFETKDLKEFMRLFNEKNRFVKSPCCSEESCLDEIKAKTGGVTARCIAEDTNIEKCIFCGKEAKHIIYFGKSY